MKSVNYLFVLGIAVLVCGCSNEETMTPVTDSDTVIETSIVPIQLGVTSVAVDTRAAISDDGSGTIRNLAVWCLAKDAMQDNSETQNIKWFGSASDANSCCVMNNVKSSIYGNAVKWDDGNARYFYPLDQFYRYEFYANYPYTNNVTFTETSVAAHYTIDGTQDLIWGRATSDVPFAWSARYFRVNGGQTEQNCPTLKMEHLMTRLVFHVQPGANVDIPGATEDELDYSSARTMIVDSLQICNAHTQLTINVADYNNKDMSIGSRLICTNNTSDTLSLKDSNGTIVRPIQVPNLPSLKARWGESIMLFPADLYKVRLVLHDAIGRKFISEMPLSMGNQVAGFERGKSYNVTITVHGPTVVSLGAQLTPWDEVDGPELIL